MTAKSSGYHKKRSTNTTSLGQTEIRRLSSTDQDFIQAISQMTSLEFDLSGRVLTLSEILCNLNP